MIWNIIFLALLIILLTPVRLDIGYTDRLTVNIRYFGIKKDMGRSKTKKSSKGKKNDKPAKENVKKNKQAKTRFFKNAKAEIAFWETKWKAYAKTLKMAIRTCCKLRTVRLTGGFFCGDMAWTGLVFGLISSVLATLKPKKCVDIMIVPEFAEQKTNVKFFLSAYVWLVGLLFWGVILGSKFLIDLVRFKKVGHSVPGEE
ncbi:hypothetical protein FACS1894198_2890 [Clostridia bacterium]|nr:hypothetical protein FACS1894198_2890 [Clostridia bacterium]